MPNYNMSMFNGTDQHITTVNTYMHFLNDATNGAFGMVLPFAIFALVFAALKKFGDAEAASIAGVVTVGVNVMFFYMGVVYIREVVISLVLMAISAAWWWRTR